MPVPRFLTTIKVGLKSRSIAYNFVKYYTTSPTLLQAKTNGNIDLKTDYLNQSFPNEPLIKSKQQDQDQDKDQDQDLTKVPKVDVKKFEYLTAQDLQDNNIIDAKITQPMIANGWNNLTLVQQKSITRATNLNQHLVVHANTGTGKTLAFGIPCLQAAYNERNLNGKVISLILAPTRDLALQIVDQLNKIVKKLPPPLQKQMSVGIMVGGTKPDNLSPHRIPKILVATPGRLRANLEKRQMADAMQNLKIKVYDEADRLLEVGFKEELYGISEIIDEMQQSTPNRYKTMLFSATMDDSVKTFADTDMNGDYFFVNAISEAEKNSISKIHQQLHLTNDMAQSFESSFKIVSDNLKNPHFKAIFFLPTVQLVDLMTRLMINILKECGNTTLRVCSLHGTMTQGNRNKNYKNFKASKPAILFATDVAARGLDFPNVTDVIQVGPSMNTADYIHKIGRTGRADNFGNAHISLSDIEGNYTKKLTQDQSVEFNKVDNYQSDEEIKLLIQNAVTNIPKHHINEAMVSMLKFQRNIVQKYGLAMIDATRESLSLFRYLLNDPDARFDVSSMFVTKTLNLQSRGRNRVFGLDHIFNMNDINQNQNRNHTSRFNQNDQYATNNDQSRYQPNYQSRNSNSNNDYNQRHGGSYKPNYKKNYDSNYGHDNNDRQYSNSNNFMENRRNFKYKHSYDGNGDMNHDYKKESRKRFSSPEKKRSYEKR